MNKNLHHLFYPDRLEISINPVRIKRPTIFDAKYLWDIYEKEESLDLKSVNITFSRQDLKKKYSLNQDFNLKYFPTTYISINNSIYSAYAGAPDWCGYWSLIFNKEELEKCWRLADYVCGPVKFEDTQKKISFIKYDEVYEFKEKEKMPLAKLLY